jgi:hypothetical protein
MLLRCEGLEPPTSQLGQTRSFGFVGSMSGLPETGHDLQLDGHAERHRRRAKMGVTAR